MTERALCVLACKYVDDVVLGPPHVPDAVFLKTMKVHAVVVHDAEDAARHSAAEHLDILHTVDTEFPGLSTKSLCQRILDQRELYTSRNEAKTAKDARNFENMKANNIDYSMVREV
jgi:glycerol-3-phosphate cytidylyltransferase-like family protein